MNDLPSAGIKARSPRRPPAVVRRQRLEERVFQDGFVAVSEVARELSVSEMTIRRDLQWLERQGTVERYLGGALPVAHSADEMAQREERPFARRACEHQQEKIRIARTAAEYIDFSESIGLDVGTTVCELARELTSIKGLNVITSSLRTVMALAEVGASNCAVHLLGGRARLEEGALCGPITIQQLAGYSLDRVFLGAAGLTPEGLFDFSIEDSEVKKAFIRRAGEVILLCDASKFGKRSLRKFASLDALSMVVTDAPPPLEIAESLKRNGVAFRIANSE